MNEKAPTGFPPILLDIDYATQADAKISAPAEVAGGQLIVHGGGHNTIGGHPFSETGYQDFTLDASVSLAGGGDRDLAGIFLRQSTATDYVAMALSPAGYIYVATIAEGIATPAAEGPLTPNIPFQRGMGAWNRITVGGLRAQLSVRAERPGADPPCRRSTLQERLLRPVPSAGPGVSCRVGGSAVGSGPGSPGRPEMTRPDCQFARTGRRSALECAIGTCPTCCPVSLCQAALENRPRPASVEVS